MKIRIIKENKKFMLIWKNQGIPVTPTKQNPSSLITELVEYKPALKAVQGYKKNEYGLINRLDNQTGGIVIVAKTNEAFYRLKKLMINEKIVKTYLAYSYNNGCKKSGIINTPIAHHKRKKKKMVLALDTSQFRGKPQQCETYFELIKEESAVEIWSKYLDNMVLFPSVNINKLNKNKFTWVLCKIRKGKRHQIRLHLHSIGYPILFDDLYSVKEIKHLSKNGYHQLYSIGIDLLEEFN